MRSKDIWAVIEHDISVVEVQWECTLPVCASSRKLQSAVMWTLQSVNPFCVTLKKSKKCWQYSKG